MATIRQLPSGNWQALVYVKGERIPFTDNSKTVVENWAREQEDALKQGRWRDPRLARITLTEWHATWLRGRVVLPNTEGREDSTWRVWIEPKWGSWTLEELAANRDAIKEWVKELVQGDDAGTWTIHNIVKLLGKMLGDAVDSGRIGSNPAVRLDVPTAPRKPPFFWRGDEAAAIIEAAQDIEDEDYLKKTQRGGSVIPVLERRYSTFIDFDMHVGPRIEELAGLLVDCVDLRTGLVHIVRVAVDGTLRDYPKTGKSYRSVPLPGHLADPFARLIHGRRADDPVFPSPGGGYLNDNNFRNRIFSPALRRARLCDCERFDVEGNPTLCEVPSHKVRWGSPNDMRHTAASWQVMAGVDIYRVQDLLGHEKVTTTQRYAHLDPSKHDAVRAVWGDGGLAVSRRRVKSPVSGLPR